jgi:hypothetical protein
MLDEIRNPLPLSARGLPEAELLPDADAARAVKEQLKVNRRSELGWPAFFAWPPVLITIGIGVLIATDLLLGTVTHALPRAVEPLVSLLLPFLVVAVLGTLVQRRVAGLAVRVVLLDRGIPVCRGCGYDLTLVPEAEPRCPECGRARTDPAFYSPGAPSSDQSADRSDRSASHTV